MKYIAKKESTIFENFLQFYFLTHKIDKTHLIKSFSGSSVIFMCKRETKKFEGGGKDPLSLKIKAHIQQFFSVIHFNYNSTQVIDLPSQRTRCPGVTAQMLSPAARVPWASPWCRHAERHQPETKPLLRTLKTPELTPGTQCFGILSYLEVT